MHRRQAPGNTCLTAIRGGVQGTVVFPVNNSKGCGGAMRIAPAGLIADSVTEAMRLGAELAAMTHGHPLGWLSAAAQAGMIQMCISGASVLQAVDRITELLPKLWPEHQDASLMAAILDMAQRTAYMAIPDDEAVDALGAGWVGEEAVAIAVCCALRYPEDVKGCLRMAVNHSGDSDSVGAIAGNLLGASLREDQLPRDWLENIQGKELVIRAAEECVRGTGKKN